VTLYVLGIRRLWGKGRGKREINALGIKSAEEIRRSLKERRRKGEVKPREKEKNQSLLQTLLRKGRGRG